MRIIPEGQNLVKIVLGNGVSFRLEDDGRGKLQVWGVDSQQITVSAPMGLERRDGIDKVDEVKIGVTK